MSESDIIQDVVRLCFRILILLFKKETDLRLALVKLPTQK